EDCHRGPSWARIDDLQRPSWYLHGERNGMNELHKEETVSENYSQKGMPERRNEKTYCQRLCAYEYRDAQN
ncbi:hypothetical protein Tco_0547061, partial [Tanacetum coccineum]